MKTTKRIEKRKKPESKNLSVADWQAVHVRQQQQQQHFLSLHRSATRVLRQLTTVQWLKCCQRKCRVSETKSITRQTYTQTYTTHTLQQQQQLKSVKSSRASQSMASQLLPTTMTDNERSIEKNRMSLFLSLL